MHQHRFQKQRRLKNLYHVNFIDANEFFTTAFMKTLDDYRNMDNAENNFKKDSIPLKKVVNPKYRFYKNIDWCDGFLFVFWHTPLIPLPIHTDIDYEYTDYKLGYGLNYNLYNNSTVNFYQIRNLVPYDKEGVEINNSMQESEKLILNKTKESRATLYSAKSDPDESYLTQHNDVYIINTTTPHQLTASQGRICLSVRPNYFQNKDWTDFFEFFRDSIKD